MTNEQKLYLGKFLNKMRTSSMIIDMKAVEGDQNYIDMFHEHKAAYKTLNELLDKHSKEEITSDEFVEAVKEVENSLDFP